MIIKELQGVKLIKVDGKIKGLIFDCDGTIVDSMPLHIESWAEAFNSENLELPDGFIDKYKGIPTKVIVEIYNKNYGKSLDPEKFAKKKNDIVKEKLKFAKPIDEVVEIAHQFKGKLPMAVASGGNIVNVEISLKAIGLENYFDAIVTSNDNVKPKPAPDIFLEAARRINIDPEFCQVFEDGEQGIEAAENAGMVVTDVRDYIGK